MSAELQVVSKEQESFLQKYNIDQSGWRTLKQVIFPNVKDDKNIIMALEYCHARHLDIFKRPVHLVPMWDSERGCNKIVVMPGVYEIRTTAARTGEYAGMDSPRWGEKITVKNNKGEEIEVPDFCQITIYRLIKGTRVPFVGPEVYFSETAATKRDGSLNAMWSQRPRGQLQKCAEAAALRCAFPDELGGVMVAEEMEDKPIEPSWLPAYTEEQHEQFMKLYKNGDSVEFYLFMDSLPTTAKIELYNSFPQGKKTSGKEICNSLEKQGYEEIQNILASLEETEEQTDFNEIWEELSDTIKKHILVTQTNPELLGKIEEAA
jgi:phage recombination protein Bet